MFELVTKNVPFPKPYPGVTRKPPTVSDKGWDKVGGYTLRDKIDFIPQKGMQERVVACQSNLIFLCGESQMGNMRVPSVRDTVITVVFGNVPTL